MKVARQKDNPRHQQEQIPDSAAVTSPLNRLRNRVFQPVQKRLYEPLNRLVDRLGYVSSVLLLIGVSGASAAAIYLWNNPDKAQAAMIVARFYLDARNKVPPRDPATFEVSRDLTNQLKDYISPSNSYSSWTAAQMTVSLRGQDAFDVPAMSRWLMGNEGDCHCWRDVDGYPHLGATGWVLLAFARMAVKPTEQQIEFVLNNQHRPGWWATYPATDDPENASTYSTAYCTWALEELLERDLIAPAQRTRAAEAVRKGRSWLVDNGIPGKPGRWKDYPNGGYGAESIGASGLVVHVLHRTPGRPLPDIDRGWMENLPGDLPGPRDEVSSGQLVVLTDGTRHSDATHHFGFPWLIIATVDAYGQGTLVQRAQAARLFHQIPKGKEVIAGEWREMPWLAAETLIALRHLQGDDVI